MVSLFRHKFALLLISFVRTDGMLLRPAWLVSLIVCPGMGWGPSSTCKSCHGSFLIEISVMPGVRDVCWIAPSFLCSLTGIPLGILILSPKRIGHGWRSDEPNNPTDITVKVRGLFRSPFWCLLYARQRRHGPQSGPERLIKQTYSVHVSLPADRSRGIIRKWHLSECPADGRSHKLTL